jgi:hypothetical protein
MALTNDVHVKPYVKTVRYLKTSQAATGMWHVLMCAVCAVEHLCEYLRQRITIDTQQELAQAAKAMSLEAIKLEDGADEKSMSVDMPALPIYFRCNEHASSRVQNLCGRQ